MRIATWNVNSIRVREPAVLAWLARWQPDVLCLQELKVEEKDFPRGAIEAAGYRATVYGQKTYNGVAILSREEPTDVVRGFADGAEEDPQRRLIRGTVAGVRIVNGYFVNGEEVGSEKFAYKLAWFARLLRVLETQEDPTKPLVLLGDFNVAPADIDVHDPKRWKDKVLCSTEERAAYERFLAWGLTDTLRMHHPEGGIYSWWDYRLAAFQRKWGLRIDHVLATAPLAARSKDCVVDVEPRGAERPSDHAPVYADFD
ncbi:MAG: exodeoxyribonuclease III [Planctomycetota bacterium]